MPLIARTDNIRSRRLPTGAEVLVAGQMQAVCYNCCRVAFSGRGADAGRQCRAAGPPWSHSQTHHTHRLL